MAAAALAVVLAALAMAGALVALLARLEAPEPPEPDAPFLTSRERLADCRRQLAGLVPRRQPERPAQLRLAR
jgi:hypothetical protein